MAFTGRLRFLFPLTKTVPLVASGLGFGFTVSAAEAFERPEIPKVRQIVLPEVTFPKLGTDVTYQRVPVPGGESVPILRISSDQVKIDTAALNSLLDKVGNRAFAIYSVNGPARTGKSFMLNYFIRLLKFRSDQDNNNSTTKSSKWMDSTYASGFTLFKWRGATERCTKGINIWSEPLEVVGKDGTVVPVLLMDCQGAFDDHTSMNQNAIIFAISTLLSSVLIFNIMKQIEESAMQFLEIFAEYANAASVLDQRAQSGSANFQKLIILVRDFDFRDYTLGYHTNTKTPGANGEGEQTKNYKLDKVNPQPHQPKEIQDGRMSILSAFEDVSVYLMPEPGRPLRREDRADQLEPDFQEHLQNFVELMLNADNITTKRVNGIEVTGTEFKEYVAAWAAFDWGRDLPKIQTIRKATEEVHYQQSKKTALELYQIVMKPVREFEYQLEEKDLLVRHERALAECHEFFMKKRKIGGSAHDERFKEEFRLETDKMWDDIKVLNKSKPWNTYWTQIISYSSLLLAGLGGVIIKWWSGGIF